VHGAYITFDPSNALIEVEVCVGPFIVMESVGNCPVTQMFFFITATKTLTFCFLTRCHIVLLFCCTLKELRSVVLDRKPEKRQVFGVAAKP